MLNSKQSLEQINEVSQQLLSCVLTVQNNIQENANGIQAAASDNDILKEEITKLLTKRDMLIRDLFTQNLSAEIAIEQQLLTNLITLDKQLSDNFQVCKKSLSAQVIKLKKGSKIAKSYQKY